MNAACACGLSTLYASPAAEFAHDRHTGASQSRASRGPNTRFADGITKLSMLWSASATPLWSGKRPGTAASVFSRAASGINKRSRGYSAERIASVSPPAIWSRLRNAATTSFCNMTLRLSENKSSCMSSSPATAAMALSLLAASTRAPDRGQRYRGSCPGLRDNSYPATKKWIHCQCL